MNIGLLFIFTIIALMSFVTFFILRFIRFKNESKHLSAENKKLKKTIDKVFKDAENYNNLYIKTMNEYERLRDAVIKDNFLYQFDKMNKIINELQSENKRLKDLIEERDNRIRDLELDKNLEDLFRIYD